ncbi:MAG: CoA transferase [Eubacterium sp.]|nr:CoA transferase [Eubacterium sp.]
MSRPLDNIRVLDLTQAYSGPFCTMQLADLGAEVIKIESPDGDQSRGWRPFKNDWSAYFAGLNRNKYGIVINLKTEEGKQALRDLIAVSDVLCENFKVGTLERLGFSYQTMQEINPRLIYASVSGYGTGTSYSDRPAYDLVAQAKGGLMTVTGHIGGEPVTTGPAIADSFAGAYMCIGILTALHDRERTGKGSRVDISMLDTVFSILENAVVRYTVVGDEPGCTGDVGAGAAPFDSYMAKDGKCVICCATDRLYHRLCDVMGKPEMKTDPRYLTGRTRYEHYFTELKPTIESWTTTKTLAELEDIMTEAGIPYSAINKISAITESDLIRQRNMLWEIYQPGMDSEIRFQGCPVKIDTADDSIRKAAPLLGEDSYHVFRDLLGYDEAQIEKLI